MRNERTNRPPTIEDLTNASLYSDWRDAVIEAQGDIRSADPNTVVDRAPFAPEDVAAITAYAEGQNDEESWLLLGSLADGRWFALDAWCDYTGWDCQSGGQIAIANDEATALQFGFNETQRGRLIRMLP